MALRLLTASPLSRLLSAEEARSYLGLGSVTTYDAKIAGLQDAISRTFAEKVGFTLPRSRWEETTPGSERQRLILSVRPIDRDSLSITLDDVALDATLGDYQIEDAAQGVIFRKYGWNRSQVLPGNDGKPNTVATYIGGYVLPELLSTWASGAAVTAGKWIRPSSPALSSFLFEVQSGGSLGTVEPTWPTTGGTEFTDGDAGLVARDAHELPAFVTLAAQITLKAWFGERGASPLAVPGNLTAERHGSTELSYAAGGASAGLAEAIPRPAIALLELLQ